MNTALRLVVFIRLYSLPSGEGLGWDRQEQAPNVHARATKFLPHDAVHKRRLCRDKMSVRLSHAGILSKQLNILSEFHRHHQFISILAARGWIAVLHTFSHSGSSTDLVFKRLTLC